MKVNELRIGSFLNEGNYIIKINGFTPFSHSIRCDEEEGCDVLFDIITKEDEISKGWACDLNDLTPIPLTEEWLVKFGFKAESSYGNFIFNGIEISSTVRVISTNERRHFNLVGKYEIIIDYVHQLQNLYHSLTGEELTIKTK